MGYPTFSSARLLVVLLPLVCWLQAATSHAISYTVTVDTTPLAAQPTPPAPFALEFQLADGGGTVSNTVTIGDLNFGVGGSATGSPTTIGGASGNLIGAVTLTDSSFFNEFVQGFIPSASDPLHFRLDLTTNVEPSTPDAFSFAILDSSGAGIPTIFFDVFVQIDIASPVVISNFASDPSLSPAACPSCPGIVIVLPDVHVVPEPGTVVLLASGLVALGLRQRRWARNAPHCTESM